MFILQHTHTPCQYADRLYFPVIFGQISPFLGHKKPRGAGCSTGQNASFEKVRLFADHEEDQSVFLLLGNGNAELGRIYNASLFQVTLNIRSQSGIGIGQSILGDSVPLGKSTGTSAAVLPFFASAKNVSRFFTASL